MQGRVFKKKYIYIYISMLHTGYSENKIKLLTDEVSLAWNNVLWNKMKAPSIWNMVSDTVYNHLVDHNQNLINYWPELTSGKSNVVLFFSWCIFCLWLLRPLCWYLGVLHKVNRFAVLELITKERSKRGYKPGPPFLGTLWVEFLMSCGAANVVDVCVTFCLDFLPALFSLDTSRNCGLKQGLGWSLPDTITGRGVRLSSWCFWCKSEWPTVAALMFLLGLLPPQWDWTESTWWVSWPFLLGMVNTPWVSVLGLQGRWWFGWHSSACEESLILTIAALDLYPGWLTNGSWAFFTWKQMSKPWAK